MSHQDGTLLALAPGALYAMPRGGRVWRRMPLTSDERFSDMTLAGDSVVVTGLLMWMLRRSRRA